ncbi:MAG TPA: UvrD-helicase domain-containing protein [Candidatus Thermoplasmatota archaeon]|nr:UvrD-helicase domain-containing protein [Candidatus Thermoplasmatota archaeon]
MSIPLTREQEAAVRSDAHALEIRAGAGTGKTTTLVRRVARHAREGEAARLQVITFTRDATATLARRLSILLGRDHDVRVSTFHQWAARELPAGSLRFFDERLGRQAVERALAGASLSLRRSLGSGRDEAAPRVLALLGYLKCTGATLPQALAGPYAHLAPWADALSAAQEAYEARKGDALDFDDLMIRFAEELRRSPSFRARVLARLDHLFVDEYQDVNAPQAAIVHALTTGRQAARATVVGDARQSIYGFRGGAPSHLEGFLAPYGRRGRRLALTVNFRAARRLVQAANAALPDAHPLRARPRAPQGDAPEVLAFPDPESEAAAVADAVEGWLARGEDPAEIAVLGRARHHLAAVADALAARAATPRARFAVELPRVALSTIHAAKGLEWNRVVLVGAREGGLPSEQALLAPPPARDALLAEERRLLYVALTRARRTFLATWSPGLRRAAPSRFLHALSPGAAASA